MTGRSVGSDANRLSCFLFRPRKRLEKRKKRSHTNVSNASATRASRVSQTPLQAPFPTSINGYHAAKKFLSQWPAKRSTFAFAGESGYTLAFANRIAHSGLHGETGGVLGGGGITTLGAFRTFTNIPGPGVRTANFAAFRSWPGVRSRRTQRACGAAMRLCASLLRGVAAPLGCVIFFASVEIGICTSGAHGFLRVRGRGGITTPGVLRMLLKLPAPACQSD